MILAGIAALLLSHQASFPKDIAKGIIEDFESGSFANWKIAGSFGRANLPTNAAEFNIRYKSTPISNFEGKFFALSLDRSNSETGKAVSPSFEIPKDWTQISFDILGGNDPTKTAFRLIRDDNGGVVRSASGDGTLTFARKSWNVNNLSGIKVHFEIEDSATTNYGFIGLDNIRGFSDDNSLANASGENWPSLAKVSNPLGFDSPYNRLASLLNRSLTSQQSQVIRQILDFVPPDLSQGLSPKPFGVTELDLRKLCYLITSEVLNEKYTLLDTSSASIIEKGISSGLKPFFEQFSIVKDSALGERLRAQAYSDWTRTRILYDHTYNTWDQQRKTQGDQSPYVLSWSPRRAVCGGIQVTFRDLCRAGGLKCQMITCHTRERGDMPSKNANHTVVIVTFNNGVSLPFDGSSCTVSLSDARKMEGAIHSHWALPISRNELAIFMAYRHQFNEFNTSFGDPQNKFKFVDQTLAQWENWKVKSLDQFEPKPMLNSGFFDR